jgi:NitT/TauT family transport system ATP-binding protein
MVRWQQIGHSAANLAAVRGTYRPDLYRSALAPLNAAAPSADTKVEGAPGASDGFFDARVFDPEQFDSYLHAS